MIFNKDHFSDMYKDYDVVSKSNYEKLLDSNTGIYYFYDKNYRKETKLYTMMNKCYMDNDVDCFLIKTNTECPESSMNLSKYPYTKTKKSNGKDVTENHKHGVYVATYCNDGKLPDPQNVLTYSKNLPVLIYSFNEPSEQYKGYDNFYVITN